MNGIEGSRRLERFHLARENVSIMRRSNKGESIGVHTCRSGCVVNRSRMSHAYLPVFFTRWSSHLPKILVVHPIQSGSQGGRIELCSRSRIFIGLSMTFQTV